MWIAIGLLALLGCVLSARVVILKREALPLACPVGRDCDRVLRGPYSLLAGIPHEFLGLGYYGSVAVYALVAYSGGGTLVGSPSDVALFTVIAGAAALYSTVLLVLQATVLRARCALCLASTALSVLIFLVRLA